MTAPYRSLLEEALEAWHYTREGVIAELELIPDERLTFRPTPKSRSVAELARHILEAGLIASGELTRADGDFRRQSWPDFMREYATHVSELEDKDGLIDQLRLSHAAGDASFREVGELAMLQHIHRFDGLPGTRLAWFWHHIDHESYHRGQLALYARILGLVPALTQAIEASP